MDSRIESALPEAFPGRDVEDVGATGPSWNDANETVRVTFADGDDAAYLKVGDSDRIERERAVVEYVGANVDVGAPDVLACDAGADPPYLVTSPIEGTPYLGPWSNGDDADRVELVSRFGAALARVHERRFDEHGHVVGGGADGLELDSAPWHDVFAETIARKRELVPCDRFDDYFDRVADAVADASDRLDDAPATLLHGDPSRPNVFCDPFGFVDWEIAHVGDPVRELVRVRGQQLATLRGDENEELVRAFHDGYRAEAGDLPDGYESRRPVYRTMRVLMVAGHFERQAEFYDVAESELAEWLTEELDRRLAAI